MLFSPHITEETFCSAMQTINHTYRRASFFVLLYVLDTGIRDQLTIGFAAVANLAMAATWGPLQTITVEVYPTVIR